MIYESLHILTKKLDFYLRSASDNLGETQDIAALGNIAFAELSNDQNHQNLVDQVIVSLISVEEDPSLKNQRHFVKKNDQYEKQNPKVFANLNILISAYYPDEYNNSLKMLNRVVQFFQGESIIKYKDSPLPELAQVNNIDSLEINQKFSISRNNAPSSNIQILTKKFLNIEFLILLNTKESLLS